MAEVTIPDSNAQKTPSLAKLMVLFVDKLTINHNSIAIGAALIKLPAVEAAGLLVPLPCSVYIPQATPEIHINNAPVNEGALIPGNINITKTASANTKPINCTLFSRSPSR